MNFNGLGEGVYIKLSKERIMVCIRKDGEETHLVFPISDLVFFEESFFRMIVTRSGGLNGSALRLEGVIG